MKKQKVKVLGISGSTKSTSSSLSILEFIKEKYHDNIELCIYDKISDLPHFNPELEEQLPSSVFELRELIKKSEGIIFCTPEYVFSLPGCLKNVIEWNVSTTLFSSKPVAMIVAASSGEKAFESLDLVLTTVETILPENSKLLIQGVKGKINKNGKLTDNEIVLKLDKVITSLINTIDDENRNPTKYK
ncbi:NAD(P)H-dependent oxidoreductase [Maribacter sp. TH_r10]|uniref:FMN reductase n=1 Tax=Maribacter luteus TaxID=2594478 RepID=A0A6I2MK06_9FLAO|nr:MULTISPECIES: NAD(P)H-dependent oxidoreductase [Maribacter]MDV7140363.1 NAD(P)H-dependent oxidoreductase [Maribacter sp. TH_r10]MRX63167.1 FMN reductase [Maribacter luteus]